MRYSMRYAGERIVLQDSGVAEVPRSGDGLLFVSLDDVLKASGASDG